MRRRYGASPLHLAAHVVAFAAMGWAILALADVRAAGNVAAWFVGALVLQYLVLIPAYSLLDRAARGAVGRRAINAVRVPALLSALLALVWFPTILGRNDATFGRVAGTVREDALAHWLALTAALFAASALVWLVRGRRAAASPPSAR